MASVPVIPKIQCRKQHVYTLTDSKFALWHIYALTDNKTAMLSLEHSAYIVDSWQRTFCVSLDDLSPDILLGHTTVRNICCGRPYLLSFQHKSIKIKSGHTAADHQCQQLLKLVKKQTLNVVWSNFIFSMIKMMKIRKYAVIGHQLAMSSTGIIVDTLIVEFCNFASCVIRLYNYLQL